MKNMDYYIERIMHCIDADRNEIKENMAKYRTIFNTMDFDFCQKSALDLCKWLLSKELKNNESEWARYSAFKYMFCEDWIDEKTYQNICSLAADKLVYEVQEYETV